ncbi:hypothetical protein, partial [Ruminococcus sp.]|uniref:hypothetical protein n=1 Tax=Ruminococcus sp. TaxID=41978 RepID=UPI003AF7DBAF
GAFHCFSKTTDLSPSSSPLQVMTAGKRADFRICSRQTRDKMLPSETSSLSCRHDLQGTTAR